MTTFLNNPVKCPMCGYEWSEVELGSTNEFGSPDLDTRPPEMMRSTMAYWISECPECGYVAADMERMPMIRKSFIEKEAYKTCDGFDFVSNLSRAFYRYYLILRKKHRNKDAIFTLLHTIWTCDDANDPNAVVLRQRLAEIIERRLSIKRDESLDLIRADLLRRSGQFERLIDEYKDKKYSENLLNNIIKFQIKLAEEKDDKCHLVSEAEYME